MREGGANLTSGTEMAQSKQNRASEARVQRVAGRHNPRLKALRQAFRRGDLTERGECAIEGVKLVEEAVRSRQKLGTVFFAEFASAVVDRLLNQLGARVEALLLPDALFKSIVPSESPQGVAALVEVRVPSASEMLEHKMDGPFVVAAGLQDPGNLGTMLRSAEAFECAGVFLTEGTVSPYNWKALRGSAGSIFRLPAARVNSQDLIQLLKRAEVRTLAASSHQGVALPEANWKLPAAIFIGNEGAGISHELLHQMDETVFIPQSTRVESLNAGVAASIILYEMARQRRGAR
jgi:TrmH family RNA methyltransferase